MFLAAPRYEITFKKNALSTKLFDKHCRSYKKTQTKQKSLNRKEKLCDISDCTNFAFLVVTESNKEFLV